MHFIAKLSAKGQWESGQSSIDTTFNWPGFRAVRERSGTQIPYEGQCNGIEIRGKHTFSARVMCNKYRQKKTTRFHRMFNLHEWKLTALMALKLLICERSSHTLRVVVLISDFYRKRNIIYAAIQRIAVIFHFQFHTTTFIGTPVQSDWHYLHMKFYIHWDSWRFIDLNFQRRFQFFSLRFARF